MATREEMLKAGELETEMKNKLKELSNYELQMKSKISQLSSQIDEKKNEALQKEREAADADRGNLERVDKLRQAASEGNEVHHLQNKEKELKKELEQTKRNMKFELKEMNSKIFKLKS